MAVYIAALGRSRQRPGMWPSLCSYQDMFAACIHAHHHACSGAAGRACRYMPLAVTHFVGSGLFNRALRYWARTATQAAKAYNSNADGFQLSDLILTPIRKGKPEVKGDRQYKNTEVGLRSQVQQSDGLQLPFHA